ncbi:MAG: hypothetical protein HZB16_11705 [Armatimonadetes bacterium]|nr:hypothetical protein [Armatimonadota bacterium]
MRRLTYQLGAVVALVLLAGCGGSGFIGAPSEGFFAPTADEASMRDLAVSTASGGLADGGVTSTGTANALWALSWLGTGLDTRAAFGPLGDVRTRRQRTTATVARLAQRQIEALPTITPGTTTIDHHDDITGLHWTGTVRITQQSVSAQLVGRDGVHELAAGLEAAITNGAAIRVVLGVNGTYALDTDVVTVRMQTEMTGTLLSLQSMIGEMSGRHNAAVEVRAEDGSLLYRSSESMTLTGYLNGNRTGLDFTGSTSIGEQFETGLWWVRTQESLKYAGVDALPPIRGAKAESDMTVSGHIRCLASNGMNCDMTITDGGIFTGSLRDAQGNEIAVVDGEVVGGVLVTFIDAELGSEMVLWGLL